MVLSGRNATEFFETPLSETAVQPNSVDVRLAGTWARFSEEMSIIDPKQGVTYTTGSFADGVYQLMPGEFVLMATQEIVHIPEGIVAIIAGRSSIARLGVQIESAGLVDSNFRGTLTLEVKNLTDHTILLHQNMRIAHIYFLDCQKSDKRYGAEIGSKYNEQIVATGSRIDADVEFLHRA